MSDALIGFTGFVGSNLLRQRSFDGLYNSKNFLELKDQTFQTLVCAGISAVKWKANKEPEADWKNIHALWNVLKTTRAERFVLISTIDVYPQVQGHDESFDCHSETNHAYGTHRLRFEDLCREHFDRCIVIRLPGLFGKGLRKNVIYDLQNENCLEMINPDCSFQYYALDRLCSDIEIVMKSGLPLVNLFTQPIKTSTIIQKFFPHRSVGQAAGPEVHYDLQTAHAELWGKPGPYMQTADETLVDLATYLQTQDGKATL